MSPPSGPSQPSQTADPPLDPPKDLPKDPPTDFKSMLDAALIKYKEKSGKDLRAIWPASELQTCESFDSVLDLLRAKAKKLGRSYDQKLIEWIDPLVHVLSPFSGTLGVVVSLAFPPAKVIFTGIDVFLRAAKDARANRGNVIDLFERIESLFKLFEVYNPISLDKKMQEKMAEVLVKIVIELHSILSIATKEVEQGRAKL